MAFSRRTMIASSGNGKPSSRTFIANAEAAWTRELASSLEIFICMQRADHRRPGDDTCLCPPRALRRSAEPRGKDLPFSGTSCSNYCPSQPLSH